MFFLFYRETITQTQIAAKKAGNDVIDIFTSEDMENTSRGPGCSFVWVVYFPVKHPCLYNNNVPLSLELVFLSNIHRALRMSHWLCEKGSCVYQKISVIGDILHGMSFERERIELNWNRVVAHWFEIEGKGPSSSVLWRT